MDRRTYEWTEGHLDGQKDIWVDRRTYGGTEGHIDGQKDTIVKNSFLIIKNFKSTNLKFCFDKTLHIHMYKICLKFHDDLLSGCGEMGGTKSHEMDK